MPGFLKGRRILIADDQVLTALDLAGLVEEHEGEVAGPAGRLSAAEELAADPGLHGAILDIDLDGTTSYELADTLIARGLPVVFVTGYGAESMPDRFTEVPRLEKPFTGPGAERILRAAFAEL